MAKAAAPTTPGRPRRRYSKEELEETGLFQVDGPNRASGGGDFGAFKPNFGKYQVIVMNYDAPDERWPESLKTAFESHVNGGGGLVVVHAADNAFAGWQAFNEMIGIGGWRGRTEKIGPAVVLQRRQASLGRQTGPRRKPRQSRALRHHRAGRKTT